jgi:CarboxypepD_reg-like domain/TonB-dependent Receptor Plug Domain
MQSIKKIILVLVLIFNSFLITTAQITQRPIPVNPDNNPSQHVHGYLIDAESKQALSGVTVILVTNPQICAVTDTNGYFMMNNVPLGRQSFQFSRTGFETYTVSAVLVITGKELQLNIALNENFHQLQEVLIKSNRNRIKPMNEFATVSSRSFSADEMRRFSGSIGDPARAAMNFPGVSSSNDANNSIVVRGNSPKGVLWRLEGIEIPNPNHFSGLGTSGGAISMINANVLSAFDFYTGAFPPEIGNALSGVFDLNFRNGNTERYEHTVQVSALSVELATEGPFEKNKKASYLVSYRYSNLALLKRFIGDVLPGYQDASFKINLPAKKWGTFSFFGLGGYTRESQDAIPDSAVWTGKNSNRTFESKTMMGVVGMTHQYFLTSNASIKTIISFSSDRHIDHSDTLNPTASYISVPNEQTRFINNAFRVAIMYNQKLNARNTFKIGITGQQLGYELSYSYYNTRDQLWKNLLSGSGHTQLYQAYIQWKTKISQRLTVVAGMHGSYFALNGSNSIEPRASIVYQNGKSKISLAGGWHSKPEHISTYIFQNTIQGQAIIYPNKNLDLLRAFHTVLGYETTIWTKLRFKAELYYQKLYHIPVERDSVSGFSILNAADVFSVMEAVEPLVREGAGKNIGIDISMERPMNNNYFLLASASLFKSVYSDYLHHVYNTRYNRGYQLNIIVGKEFKLGTGGQKITGLNARTLYSGGLRESLIDIPNSIVNQRTEIVTGEYFTQQTPAYFRVDASVYYKFNTKRATHTLQLEAQNITNRKNYYYSYFDITAGQIRHINQLGLIPNISYRIDFHR